jgi:predicted phage-related endonuclease
MSDFSPAVRDSAWWSGDSRLAAQGRANEAILIKQGKMDRPDLSNVEAVQMGHVMEPVIGRLAQERLGIELTKIEEAMAHPKESWLKSHFDFAGVQDGKKILVEAKNYRASSYQDFDAESGIVPAADLAQCVHEATVFDCETVYLAVLFGGNAFECIRLDISPQQKLEHIKQMAVYWGHVVTNTVGPAETTAQARLIYSDNASVKQATSWAEQACIDLAYTKASIKSLEAQEEALSVQLQKYLQQSSTLLSVDGKVLATWKQAKSSKRFSAGLFEQAMPDIYKQFIVDQPGSRRFLIK